MRRGHSVQCGCGEFVNYMAADMPDIQYACKEVCREMSRPSDKSWEKLKKIGR